MVSLTETELSVSASRRFVNGLKRRVVFLAGCALAAVVLGEIGRWWWVPELFSHFMLWYAPMLGLGIWAVRRRWLKAVFAMAFVAVGAALFWPIDGAAGRPAAQPMRFVSYNAYLNNERKAENARWLEQSGADILFLTEATPAWQQALESLKARYLYGCAAYEDSPFGLVLFSRLPLRRCEVKRLPGDMADYPYIRAELSDGAVLYGLHPPPPIGAALAHARDGSLEQLAAAIRTEAGAVIVLGDMNTSPFSIRFRNFLEAANLHLTAPRWQATWISGLLALDQILVRGDRAVLERGMASWMGSDHRPVWVVW